MRLIVLSLSLCVGVTVAQYPTTTPVPILKQINRHNEDGSYSYGFEAADGSYKIESKYPTGEVYGKYGFIDDTGNRREIEYGASRRGFEPAGTGINVPPPTLNGNSIANAKDDDGDDGQYREDPSIYYTDPRYTNGERYDPVPRNPIHNHQVIPQSPTPYNPGYSKSVAAQYRRPAPIQYQPQPQSQPQPQPLAQPQYAEYQPQYRTQYQRQYPQQPQPAPAQYNQAYAPERFAGHPAQNIDLNVGSYRVQYKR